MNQNLNPIECCSCTYAISQIKEHVIAMERSTLRKEKKNSDGFFEELDI